MAFNDLFESNIDSIISVPKLIFCPECALGIAPEHYDGQLAAPVCPECGERLSEEETEAEAMSAQIEYEIAQEALAFEKFRMRLAEERHDGLRPWQFAERAEAAGDHKRSATRIETLQSCIESSKAAAASAAMSRYLASTWYRSTQLLPANILNFESTKGFVPVMGDDHCFELRALDAESVPVVGEHRIFELIRSHATVPESPLYGARVVPRAQIRWMEAEGEDAHEESMTIDCAVLTSSCLFLVDVVTTDSSVQVEMSVPRISLSKDNSVKGVTVGKQAWEALKRPSKEDCGIVQNLDRATTAVQLAGLPYPSNRIRRIVVFVEPQSFACPDCCFHRGLFVGYQSGFSQNFLGAMEDECGKLSTFVTDEELACMARRLTGFRKLRIGSQEFPRAA